LWAAAGPGIRRPPQAEKTLPNEPVSPLQGVDPSEVEVDRYTTELHDTMDRKDIPYIEDMLEMAQLEGVTLLACKTSADLFDLTKEDFVEGVEIMLAADFLKRATGSDLHLMY